MRQQDQWVFESTQKDIRIETINFTPFKSPQKQPSKQLRKQEEIVNWKFSAIAPTHQRKPSTKKISMNISFEDQQFESNSSEGESNEEEQRQAEFTSYYSKSNSQQVYHKKLGFGTNWIGRRQYFSSVFVDPSRIEKLSLPYYTPESPLLMEVVAPEKCVFDSEFESGNLFAVYKVGPFEYDLLLQNDINTKGNTQWFYFRLRNPPKNKSIKLNIVNLRKPDSLFNYGMMPCIHSQEQLRRSKKGWFRGAKNIKYFRNQHQIQNSKRYYYTLTFTICSLYERDVLLLAHSFPYTVSDMNLYLDSLFRIKHKKEHLERDTIINTIGKNKVEVVTIKENNPKKKGRPYILVIARQHPGETPSSFVCEGIIDYFLAKDKESEYLRKNYEIKVIPIANPDGVVAGNYRTNLFGYDLNRRWEGGSRYKNMHEATYIKKYINQLSKNRQIAFVLDLHGHSRKLFSFFYGNPSSSNPIEPRIFPLLCSKLEPYMIRFQDSSFAAEEAKRNTARIQLAGSLKIPTIYTYEVSFFGYVAKTKQKEHFTMDSMRQLGQCLGKSIYLHQRGKELMQISPEHKEAYLYKKCINELRTNNVLISMGDRENSGSESNPEECEVREQEEGKLTQNEDYFNVKPVSKVKMVRKVVKKEPPVKEIYKSLRQMQVLDIAQVHSAFPSNIIALIPTSYLTKIRKPTLVHTSTGSQTEDSPLLRIYQSCKQQELPLSLSLLLPPYNPETSVQLPSEDQAIFLQKPLDSNFLRSSVLNRPKTTIQDSNRELTPLSVKSHRKSRDLRRREQSVSSSKKTSSFQVQSKRQARGVQTMLSFGNSSNLLGSNSPCLKNNASIGNLQEFSTLSSFKVRLSNEVDILEYKSIDPSFSTTNYNKAKSVSRSIGKNISKNIMDNLKIRRKNAGI